jgi:hypothetical protein
MLRRMLDGKWTVEATAAVKEALNAGDSDV